MGIFDLGLAGVPGRRRRVATRKRSESGENRVHESAPAWRRMGRGQTGSVPCREGSARVVASFRKWASCAVHAEGNWATTQGEDLHPGQVAYPTLRAQAEACAGDCFHEVTS